MMMLASLSADAATLTVTNTNDTGAGSLRATVAAAAAGDTIDFHASLNGGTITLTTGEIAINATLNINGPGADQLTISGNNASRVFFMGNGSATVTVSGLRVINGNGAGAGTSGHGGAIFAIGTLMLNDCVFAGNVTPSNRSGGAVWKDQGLLVATRTTFTSNKGQFGGGLYAVAATTRLVDCVFSQNEGYLGAGALTAASGGGTLVATGTSFLFNFTGSGGEGGAAYIQGNSARFQNCTFYGNQATFGGAVTVRGFAGNGTLRVVNCTVASNIATTTGGAFYADHTGSATTVELSNTIFSGNSVPVIAKDVPPVITSLGNNLSNDNGAGFLSHATDLLNTDRCSPLWRTTAAPRRRGRCWRAARLSMRAAMHWR